MAISEGREAYANVIMPTVFLLLLLLIGLVGKNQSIIIAVLFLLVVNLLNLQQKVYPFLEKQGINLGVTVITIAILIPIATGKITFGDLWDSIRSIYGIIALTAGVVVALLGSYGIKLLSDDPQITIALVIGTIFAVALFKGVAVGPLIGAGIAYVIMKAIHFFQ